MINRRDRFGSRQNKERMDGLHNSMNGMSLVGWYCTTHLYSLSRWCADSWDTMEQPGLSRTQYLGKALDPSG